MTMNKMFLRLLLAMAVAIVAACTPSPANALPPNGLALTTEVASCVTEDYTGTKLLWCQKICESDLTGPTLDTWIHRWINRYRDLPYCLVSND